MITELRIKPLLFTDRPKVLKTQEDSEVNIGCTAENDVQYFLITLGQHSRVCSKESLKEQLDYIEDQYLWDILNKLKE